MRRAGQDLYREVSVIMRRAELLRRIRAARRQEPGMMQYLMKPRFLIAESASRDLALLRWTLVLVLLWSGAMKFTAYDAHNIAPLIAESPILGWLSMFGVRGESNFIGSIQLATALALIAGAFNALFSALGAGMSMCFSLITLSFFVTTPGVAESSAGGFPAISTVPGQFLLKDTVLLAASLVLLLNSLRQQRDSGS
jgi:uncharacterized membrane protein YkgB